MSPKTAASRSEALSLIEQAQHLLNRAVAAASPLKGWANDEPRGPYYLIGDHADATKRLWHQVNNAPVPIGHDYDEFPPDEPAGPATPEAGPVASTTHP